MEVTCNKCRYKWNYKGKSAFYATCPKCHRKNLVTIWENLKYATFTKCLYCGQEFPKKRNRSGYCSALCLNRANASKGGKAVHRKYDYSGKNNPNWKGGISKEAYRYKKIQVDRFPERIRAREKVSKAKISGQIRAPPACEMCKRETKLHAHHEDYKRPLNVIWLCRSCHRKTHGGTH